MLGRFQIRGRRGNSRDAVRRSTAHQMSRLRETRAAFMSLLPLRSDDEAGGPRERTEEYCPACRSAIIGDVVFPDQAQDRGVEGSNVTFPSLERLLAVFGLLPRDLGKYPGRCVVHNIVNQLIERPPPMCPCMLTNNSEGGAPGHSPSLGRQDRQSGSPIGEAACRVVINRVENEAFDIDICTPGTANDVLELRCLDPIPVTEQGVDNYDGSREIEALRERRR